MHAPKKSVGQREAEQEEMIPKRVSWKKKIPEMDWHWHKTLNRRENPGKRALGLLRSLLSPCDVRIL